MCGVLDKVKKDFTRRVFELMAVQSKSEPEARSEATKQFYELRWGPTKIPIYNLVLVGTVLATWYRERQMKLMRWLIDEAKVPVDGIDISGAQTIHHAISCVPVFDAQFAQMLYDAGGDVNHRDRYGCTAMHEALQIHDGRSADAVRRQKDALVWYLEHGGNMDIKDNDGNRVRDVLKNSYKIWYLGGHFHTLELVEIVEDEDRRRRALADRCCAFCGREPDNASTLLVCSQCNGSRYCSPPRQCQAGDWPHHKPSCRKIQSRGGGV